MIETRNLTKTYNGFHAIKDVSFTVDRGEIVGFLGPNGAGKTTTMKILTAFMPATSGQATVEGFDCLDNALEVRKRIGYLPENAPLYTDMRVTRFLHYAAEAKGIDGTERGREVERVIEECALKEVRNRIIKQCSKGYKQRVGLAQSLLGNPPVLILDEPTIGLDPTQIIEIRSLIKALSGNRTILLCSHILPEVGMICDRIIVINRGKIIAVDKPENLTKLLRSTIRVRLEVEGPAEEVRAHLSRIEGVIKVSIDGDGVYIVDTDKESEVRGDLSSCVVQKGWKLLELQTVRMTLEEIFVQLVTKEREKGN